MAASPHRPARIYADLAGLITAIVSCSLLDSLLQFAGLMGLPTRGLWRMLLAWAFVMAAVRCLWLLCLVTVRVRKQPAGRVSDHVVRWAAVVAGSYGVITTAPGGNPLGHPLLAGAASSVTSLWLAWEVLQPHGIGPSAIGLSWRSEHPGQGKARTLRTASANFAVCAVAGNATGVLHVWVQRITPSAPVMHVSQDVAIGATTRTGLINVVMSNLVMEDVVLLAATCLLMQAARRPAWQICVLVCTLTLAGHAYEGIPAVTSIVYAAYRVVLFRRRAFLAPFLITHTLWDLYPEIIPPRLGTTMAVCAITHLIVTQEDSAPSAGRVVGRFRRTPGAGTEQAREAGAPSRKSPARTDQPQRADHNEPANQQH
jgi:hypothetical protein